MTTPTRAIAARRIRFIPTGLAALLIAGTMALPLPALAQAASAPLTATEANAQLAARAAEASAGDDPLLRQMAGSVALELHRAFGTPTLQLAVVASLYGADLPADRAEVLRKNFERSVLHPAMPLYAARRWAPLVRARVPADEFRRVQGTTTTLLKERGMARLPAGRIELFVRDLLTQVAEVDAVTCKHIFVGSDRAAVVATAARHMHTMPFDRFIELSALYDEAALAEINETTPAIAASPAQAKDALEAYRLAIRKRFIEQVPADVLSRYTVPLRDLSAPDACLLGTQALSAMLDMKEPQRSWQLLGYAKELSGAQ